MGSVSLYSLTRTGLLIQPVTIEVEITKGLPSFTIVGLADRSVHEAKERVRSALQNTGYKLPRGHIIINLAPANMKKEGSYFDLAIALGLLIKSKQIKIKKKLPILIGELGLNGELRCEQDAFLYTEWAKENNKEVCVPKTALDQVVRGDFYVASDLKEVVEQAENTWRKTEKVMRKLLPASNASFNNIAGNEFAKRGLQIAATGGHHVCLWGPPGAGKTMLAERFRELLPEPSEKEQIETQKIYAAANKRYASDKRPLRSPHHTISRVGLLGGGRTANPGEISLAHNGVLFLDELPEFPKGHIESLRQPLTNKIIAVDRAQYRARLPANFQLIAALNPCPCGYFGDEEKECTCYETARKKYIQKISGPTLDRIDMHIHVKRQSAQKITAHMRTVKTGNIIKHTRAAQRFHQQYKGKIAIQNAEKYGFSKSIVMLGASLVDREHGSMRYLTKLLSIARSIASLEQEKKIKEPHIYEALSYKNPMY